MGIERAYYKKIMLKGGLDPEDYADALFVAPGADYMLVKESIISLKTLKLAALPVFPLTT
jgi:pyrophosphate--fructose-6-phosphate 1-phosphotransferase